MIFFNKIAYIFLFVILCNGTCENYPQNEIDKDYIYRTYCLDLIENKKVFEKALSFTKKKLFKYKNTYVDNDTKERKERDTIEKYDHERKDKKILSSGFYEIIKLEDLETDQLNITIDVIEDKEGSKVVLKGKIIFKSLGNNKNITCDIDDKLFAGLMSQNLCEEGNENCFYNVFQKIIASKNVPNECIVDFENKYNKKKFFYNDNAITQCIPNSLLQGKVTITLKMPSKFHIANSTVNLRKQIIVGKDDGMDTYVWQKTKSQEYPGHMFLALNFDQNYHFDITQKFDLNETKHITGPMPFLNMNNTVKSVNFLNDTKKDISPKVKSNMYQEDNIYIGKVFDNHLELEAPKDEKSLDIEYNIISNVGILKKNIKNIVIEFANNECLGKLSHNIIEECHASQTCDCEKASWLCHWVYDYISYRQNTNSQNMSPLRLIYEKTGVCTDYVMLFLGMCSSIGIRNIYDICGYAKNVNKIPELHEWACLYCPQCKQMVAFDPTWDLCYGLPPSHLAIRTKNRVNESTYSIKPQYSITYEYNGVQTYVNDLKTK